MKITKVEPIWLRAKGFSEPCEWGEDAFLLKIYTDSGLVGVGESDSAPAVLQAMFTQPSTHGSCRNLSEVLLGRDPRCIRSILDDLYEAGNYYGPRGALIHAISAVDIALHDLVGKIYGVSVAVLLGGARRRELNAYATFIPDKDPGVSAARAKALAAQGFGLIKFGGDGFGSWGAADAAMCEAIKDAVPDTRLAIDLVGLWKNYSVAKKRFEEFARFDLEWIEEPVPPTSVECYKRLSQTLPCKVTGGEALASAQEFEPFCKESGVAIVQPDLTRCGGFSEMLKIEQIALQTGCDLVPHGFSTGILLHATAQFLCASKSCSLIEYSQSTSALMQVASLPKCERGVVSVDVYEPGIGVQLNDELIERYRVR